MKTIIFILALGLCSCNVSKKSHDYFAAHPEEFAKDCADAFPCIDSTHTVTDTVVNTVILDYSKEIDSIANSFDSLWNTKYEDSLKASLSHDKCREVVNDKARDIAELNRIISNLRANYKIAASTTLQITKHHYIRDNARETQYQYERDKARLDADKYKDKFNWWRIVAIISLAVNALFIILKFMSWKNIKRA